MLTVLFLMVLLLQCLMVLLLQCLNLMVLLLQCLKETGTHHLRLLMVISQFCTLIFFPLWLLQDGIQIWKDESLVRHVVPVT